MYVSPQNDFDGKVKKVWDRGRKKEKPTKFNSLLDVVKVFPTEQDCRNYLEKLRWPNGIACPHCGGMDKIYKFKDGKLYKCGDCKKQFTVRVGTIFEDSPLPLQKWFMALYLITAHKKGISSWQLSRDLEITQKSAWFVLHRLRYAITTKTFNKPLTGVIEVDESYWGGREANKHKHKKSKKKDARGRPTNKAAIFGMLQRDGELIAKHVPDVGSDTLKGLIKQHVEEGSAIISDEWTSYVGLRRNYLHLRVDHSEGDYGFRSIHTNSIEGFWSLLKRGIHGIYHQVSHKHLSQYVNEFAYRYNSRSIQDVDRFNLTLTKTEGRLTYKNLTKSVNNENNS